MLWGRRAPAIALAEWPVGAPACGRLRRAVEEAQTARQGCPTHKRACVKRPFTFSPPSSPPISASSTQATAPGAGCHSPPVDREPTPDVSAHNEEKWKSTAFAHESTILRGRAAMPRVPPNLIAHVDDTLISQSLWSLACAVGPL